MENPPNPIFLFTGPIETGKSRALKSFCDQNPEMAGVLNLNVNGLRKIYDIKTKTYFDFQVEKAVQNTISVGRYVFLQSGFEKMETILWQQAKLAPRYLIIDELGKLELKEKGLYEIMQKILRLTNRPPLILVVRNSLVEEVMDFFHLTNVNVISNTSEIPL